MNITKRIKFFKSRPHIFLRTYSGLFTTICIYMQVCLFILFFFNGDVKAESNNLQKGKIIHMITPENNGLIHDKKPLIECAINIPFVKDSLYVEFDYTDVSALVRLKGSKITFSPVQVISPGYHQLTISFITQNGEEIMEQFQFSSRHSKLFETAYSMNTASVGYTRVLKKYQDAKDRKMSDWETAANFGTENFLAQGPWSFNFRANGRYYDQELPNEAALEDNLELVDFLFTGKYQKSKYMVETQIGDVLINESRNTVNNLARRGGKFVAEYGVAGFSGFVVRSDQIYGSDGDYGLELDNKDHIFGVSGDVDLFKNRANLKALYVSGGTQPDDDSFGMWNVAGGTKGDVKGIILATDFFKQKFNTSFEFDRSDYDPDTSDSINAKSDKAYLLKANGLLGKFSYSAEYEYTGLYYQVPGNWVRNDYEGYTLRSNLTFEKHIFGAMYSKHNDDVEDDSIYGRTDSTEYMLDYDLNIFLTVPMRFSWSRNMEKNRTAPLDNHTDTYSSDISYMKESYSLVFAPSYSKTNDKTADNQDSSNFNLILSGAWFKEAFSIQPSIGFNRYKEYLTNIYTDTDTYSLTVTANLGNNISVNNTGSFSNLTTNDDSVDQDYYTNTFQLTYGYPKRIWGIFSPKASLGASYEKTKDKILDTQTEETIIYLTLSGDFVISF